MMFLYHGTYSGIIYVFSAVVSKKDSDKFIVLYADI